MRPRGAPSAEFRRRSCLKDERREPLARRHACAAVRRLDTSSGPASDELCFGNPLLKGLTEEAPKSQATMAMKLVRFTQVASSASMVVTWSVRLDQCFLRPGQAASGCHLSGATTSQLRQELSGGATPPRRSQVAAVMSRARFVRSMKPRKSRSPRSIAVRPHLVATPPSVTALPALNQRFRHGTRRATTSAPNQESVLCCAEEYSRGWVDTRFSHRCSFLRRLRSRK